MTLTMRYWFSTWYVYCLLSMQHGYIMTCFSCEATVQKFHDRYDGRVSLYKYEKSHYTPSHYLLAHVARLFAKRNCVRQVKSRTHKNKECVHVTAKRWRKGV